MISSLELYLLYVNVNALISGIIPSFFVRQDEAT